MFGTARPCDPVCIDRGNDWTSSEGRCHASSTAHSDLGRCLNDEYQVRFCRRAKDPPLRIAETADFVPGEVDAEVQVEFGKQKHCPMPDETS